MDESLRDSLSLFTACQRHIGPHTHTLRRHSSTSMSTASCRFFAGHANSLEILTYMHCVNKVLFLCLCGFRFVECSSISTQLNSQVNKKRPHRTHRAKWTPTYAHNKTKKDKQNKHAKFMVTLPHGRQQHYLAVF